MFGYVIIDKPEMKFREFDEYRSYYCGLCRDLKEGYGLKGQVTLNYDLTFLAILLSGLYEADTKQEEIKCIVHPFSRHLTSRNPFTAYAADMNILLTYYQCLDDWNDDKNIKKKLLGDMLKGSGRRVAGKYPDKAEIIVTELDRLSGYEKENSTDIDAVSGCFGRMMSAVFIYKQDEWSEYLAKTGFYLGKFIYILDAYIDYEEDIAKGKYNPLKECKADRDYIENLLTMMMAECCRSYEMLPIVDNLDILNNILYSGVWTGFDTKKHTVREITLQ